MSPGGPGAWGPGRSQEPELSLSELESILGEPEWISSESGAGRSRGAPPANSPGQRLKARVVDLEPVDLEAVDLEPVDLGSVDLGSRGSAERTVTGVCPRPRVRWACVLWSASDSIGA